MKQHWIKGIAAVLAVVSMLSLTVGCDNGGADDTGTTTTGEATTTTTTTATADTTSTSDTSTATGSTGQASTTSPTKVTAKTTTTTKATTKTTNKWDSIFPITPTQDIRLEAAKVNNKLTAKATKIKSDCYLVEDFDPEYGFSHCPGFTYFKGKFYASWGRGYVHEDAPGQHMVVSTSTDCKTWSEPVVIGEPHEGLLGTNTVMAGQFFSNGDTLYAFYFEHEWAPDKYDDEGNFIPSEDYSTLTSYRYVVSTTDGVHWTEPVLAGASCNEAPRKSLTNRWFAGAGDGLLYADDPTGLTWGWSGLSDYQVEMALRRGAKILTECSWYQTDDYVLHMMIRSNAGYIWMSNSYDNGETWTDPYPTKFTSASSMANFGRLPDGRYYMVGSSYYDRRYPLELYISEDGYNFNKAYILRDEIYQMQQDGWAKGGDYAYPEVFIHEGYMYIFYSKQKEAMELTRVALSDIV